MGNYQILLILLWLIPGAISIGALTWHVRTEKIVRQLAVKANVKVAPLPHNAIIKNFFLSLVPIANLYCLAGVLFADVRIDLDEKTINE